jgi:hypothetical protein
MMGTGSIGRLYDALRAAAAATTAGDPVIALSALDALDAESAALRGQLTVKLDTAGHEPLDGVCGPISAGGGPMKIATAEMGAGQHAIVDQRTRRAGH